MCCACRAVGSEVEPPYTHKPPLKFSLFDKITHGHIHILLILASICTGGTGITGSQGDHRPGYGLSPTVLLQHRTTSDQISEQMLLLCSLGKNERSRVGMHTTERKTTNENLSSTCSSLCPHFFFPKEKTAFIREETKHSTKPRQRSRHSHLGCSSSAAALPSLLWPWAAGTGVRMVPAGVCWRLLPSLLHCAKRGGSRCAPQLAQLPGRCCHCLLRPRPPRPSWRTHARRWGCGRPQMGLMPAASAWCWGAEQQSPFWPTWLALPGSSFIFNPRAPQGSASGCGGASNISSTTTALSSARSAHPKKAPFYFQKVWVGNKESEKEPFWEAPQCWRQGLGWSLQLPGWPGRAPHNIRERPWLPSAKENQANRAVRLPFQAAEKLLEGISNKAYAETPELL